VANADWASGDYLLRAERAAVQFDIKALLQRRVEVTQVTVRNADVRLETAADGRRNWAFERHGAGGVALRIDAVEVEGSRLAYLASDGTDYRVDIRQLALNGPGTAAPSADRVFTGQLAVGDAIAKFSGHVADPFEVTDLVVTLHSDRLDLAHVLEAAGQLTPVGGELHQIAARFETSGATPDALASNLGGKLEIGSAHLTLPAENGRKATDVDLTGASLAVAAGKPVLVRILLAYEKESFQVELNGGTVAELLSGGDAWQSPKVKVLGQRDGKPLEIAG
jgi:hypothetical protein